MAKIKPGELVLATKYSDKDVRDPWCVGVVGGRNEDGTIRIEGSNRDWKHVRRIDERVATVFAERSISMEHFGGKLPMYIRWCVECLEKGTGLEMLKTNDERIET